MRPWMILLASASTLLACSSSSKTTTGATTGSGGAAATGAGGASAGTEGTGASTAGAGASATTTAASTAAATSGGGDASTPCTTRITYGNAWIHGANHPDPYDVATGDVTWDGTCTDSGSSSYATLSNGWKPYFTGNGACVMALDTTCPSAPACTTRITYGSAWIHGTNHPDQYDQVSGRVTWDGACTDTGSNSYATLSNGWAPHFTGNGACNISLEYIDCGGLYVNAVLPDGCADPGVLRDGDQYVVACTSGDAASAFPMHTSTDLVSWTAAGSIFPSGKHPSWATGSFWAPEIHKVGTQYVAYFTARDSTDGTLSVGAATASSPTGPFTDIGHPLVHSATVGYIDPSEFDDGNGNHYLVWKEDGNATGNPTPIWGQALGPAGLAVTGAKVQLITNDLAWEGAVTEGPWVVPYNGSYYLFYSGNAYSNSTYAVGVARSSTPLGTYAKHGAPILTTDAAWVGPGHCSVVDTPAGDWVMVYHAWAPGHVNGTGDVREGLIDAVVWSNGWPSVPEAPSSTSRPIP